MAKKLIFVRVLGTAINVEFKIVSHEILGLPAGTYHKFILENGTTYLLNDFGIRSVTLADSPENLR